MQAVFFQLSGVLPFAQSMQLITDAVRKTFRTKGEKIIKMNIDALNAAKENIQEIAVPSSWANAPLEEGLSFPGASDFVQKVLLPTMKMEGDDLPVSAFAPGAPNPLGLTKHEKRGVAQVVPVWDADKCVSCTECAVVCPHAAIRPFLLDEQEAAKGAFPTKDAKGKNAGLKFRIQVSPYDCTGCTVCSKACRFGALTMGKFEEQKEEQGKHWDYCLSLPNKAGRMPRSTLMGSQFYQPLLEFSGCCEGCSETAYVKLLTQLYGERMVIANASGCSSVWGGTWGMIPYTTNAQGYGPAWSNSLFEENAEFGFGMAKANGHRRDLLKSYIEKIDLSKYESLKENATKWLENYNDAEKVLSVSHELRLALEDLVAKHQEDVPLHRAYENRDVLNILSHWAIGGDGWAYDINYGGLDHVIAQGHNMNILVLDTEMYSNTGGQKSKATNIGAIAKFAAGGCRKYKKDLGRIAMTYGDVFVASISLQANPMHAIKAIVEAEAYPGTSLILCYAPCKEQGFPLSEAITESKLAVESGYWPLYRFDPRKTPAMQLDQGKLTKDISELVNRENRYLALSRSSPKIAEELQGKLKDHKLKQHEEYSRMMKLKEDIQAVVEK
jgi:pyruvate-ferredoxin/flavodoxin oxidoreductase